MVSCFWSVKNDCIEAELWPIFNIQHFRFKIALYLGLSQKFCLHLPISFASSDRLKFKQTECYLRYEYFKAWAQERINWRQLISHCYDYSDKISKTLNGNTFFLKTVKNYACCWNGKYSIRNCDLKQTQRRSFSASCRKRTH